MTSSIVLIVLFSIIMANLPWLSERFFIIFNPPFGGVKLTWMRLLEWLIFGFFSLLFAWGFEQKMTGTTHSQDWEFYAICISLFVVFAYPSFLYRHLVVPLIRRNSL